MLLSMMRCYEPRLLSPGSWSHIAMMNIFCVWNYVSYLEEEKVYGK